MPQLEEIGVDRLGRIVEDAASDVQGGDKPGQWSAGVLLSAAV